MSESGPSLSDMPSVPIYAEKGASSSITTAGVEQGSRLTWESLPLDEWSGAALGMRFLLS